VWYCSISGAKQVIFTPALSKNNKTSVASCISLPSYTPEPDKTTPIFFNNPHSFTIA